MRRYRRREKQPSFTAQLIIGCLLVGAITWIATPQINTGTPRESVRREASAFYPNCNAARAAGAAPIYAGQPGYRSELDRDSDGIACEHYRGY